MIAKFKDRRQAGRVLGFLLAEYRKHSSGLILALSNGGIPVGYEVARALTLPLDVFVVPKPGGGHDGEVVVSALETRSARLAGKCVILVDDGMATGTLARAAVVASRELRAERIVVAVPVSSPEACAELSELADQTICATTPQAFTSVREWYRRFEKTTDDEVKALLRRARSERATDGTNDPRAVTHG